MEIPPGFVPARIPYIAPAPTAPPTAPTVPPVPKGLDVPPPVVYKVKKPFKEPKQQVPQHQTLRVYYVGAIMVGWIRQWFDAEGATGLYLHTFEAGLPVKTVDEADQWIVQHLRGKPREVPFMTTERLQGLRVAFGVNTDIDIAPLPNGPEGFVPAIYERPEPISQPRSPDAPTLPMAGTPPAPPAPTSASPAGEELF